MLVEERLRVAPGLGHAKEEMLGGDVVVTEPAGLGLGTVERRLGPRIE
jgi:hypothetical protein